MPGKNIFGFILTRFGKVYKSVGMHNYKTVFFHYSHGAGNARFGITEFFCYVYRAHATLFLFQSKYRFEIHFLRFVVYHIALLRFLHIISRYFEKSN